MSTPGNIPEDEVASASLDTSVVSETIPEDEALAASGLLTAVPGANLFCESIPEGEAFDPNNIVKNEFLDQPLTNVIEKCLGMSYLAFLVADLRLLSATGRIETPYQSLVIDSDRTTKLTAAQLACLETFESDRLGVTPAHLMAILLLTVREELEGFQVKRDLDKSAVQTSAPDDDKETLESTRKLNKALKSYAKQVSGDFVDESPEIKVRKAWADILQKSRKDVRQQHKIRESLRLDFDQAYEKGEFEGFLGNHAARFRLSMRDMKWETKKIQKGLEKLEDLSIFQQTSAHQLFQQNSKGRLGNIFDDENYSDEEIADGFYSQPQLLNLLKYAVKTRNGEIVNEIMPRLFRPGTVSHHMATSTNQLVWFHDWHTAKECTYGISLDREQKTVMVIFRGAITKADWGHAFECNHVPVLNPIQEDYEKKLKYIRIHSGFHRYLFRKRKDTGTTKYQEIADKAAYYFQKAGPKYRVMVCGHSLGAALGTIFSFYASTDPRFTKNGPLHAVTFGGPWVGGYQFADAFRHQEAAGKVLLARVYNVKDIVPSVPPRLFRMSKRGASAFHVGISVKLPLIRKGIFKVFGQPRPQVKYAGRETFWGSWFRQIRHNVFLNMPIRFWMCSKMHHLDEHVKRFKLIDPETGLTVKYTMQELYDKRDVLLKHQTKKD